MDGVMQGLPQGDPDEPSRRVTDRDSRELVTRLREKDASALLELFEREEKRAFALAYRVLRDAAAAEDAVQEAFAQLWERAAQLDPDGGKIEALLMTIVHRRAVDQVRRSARGSVQAPDPELLEQIDERASAMLDRVEELVSSAGLRADLRVALDALPPEQRRILEHIYGQHRSLREVAEEECVPLGTVKSRLRLAMEKLGKSLRNRSES